VRFVVDSRIDRDKRAWADGHDIAVGPLERHR
jgi:hypothetical protein